MAAFIGCDASYSEAKIVLYGAPYDSTASNRPGSRFGPGEGLFTKEFYGNCYKALREDGVMVNQHASPFYDSDATAMQRAHQRIVQSFPVSRVYQAHIPSYPSGHWLFGFASKGKHPVRDFNAAAWQELNIKTKYYTPALHTGCFALPAYVEKLLREVE
jgi:spermidine synthase